MSAGRQSKTSSEVIRNRFWAYQLLYNAHRASEQGELEEKLDTPLAWTSLERLVLKANDLEAACIGRSQSLVRVALNGFDPRDCKRLINTSEWKEAGKEVPGKTKSRTSGRAQAEYIEIKFDLVECAEKVFPGLKTWLEIYLWELLELKDLSPWRVEQITDLCLKELGLFRTHMSFTGRDPFNSDTAADYIFSKQATSAEELFANYTAELLPIAQNPTPLGLTALTSMLFEAAYRADETLTSIHADLVGDALERMEGRVPPIAVVKRRRSADKAPLAPDRTVFGLLADAIFDAAATFAEKSLPPIHLISLAFPVRKLRGIDP